MTASRALRVFFHPQRGAFLSPGPIDPRCARYRGGPDSAWVELAGVGVRPLPGGGYAHSGCLPPGFLWADPARQLFGMIGPAVAYGALERRCRDCGRAFVFTAEEQRRWYEALGFVLDSTAVRCGPCRAARRGVEKARRGWELAARAAEAGPSAERHLSAARAGLQLGQAGGAGARLIERALAHCTRAQRLGAGEVAQTLRAALRRARAAGG